VILVDTSIWVDFFRGARGSRRLAEQLDNDRVLTHPWVIGELALGDLGTQRAAILGDLRQLPSSPLVDADDVVALIDVRQLAGSGIGWVDAQLIASALIAGASLWTRDRKLSAICGELGIS